MKSLLFLLPTPIGNLKEVSPRLIECINECDYLACEDTRNTTKLLNLIGVKKPCKACHKFNENEASEEIIKDILDGKTVGFLSDAGYPCISDPGEILVKKAIENDINVIPISGPNAFLNGLVGSGLDCSKFLFYGFLNSKEQARKKELNELKTLNYTLIFYEAPHRIQETLEDMLEVFGNRNVVIARELTKVHEEFIRSDLSSLIEKHNEIKGEIVLVVEKNTLKEESLKEEDIKDKLNLLIKNGVNIKDAITSISLLYKINKNIVKKIYYSI